MRFELALVQATDGSLYRTTSKGGSSNSCLYKWPSWSAAQALFHTAGPQVCRVLRSLMRYFTSFHCHCQVLRAGLVTGKCLICRSSSRRETIVGLSLAKVRATETVRSYVNRRYASSFIPTAETPRQKKHAS